MVRLLAVRAVIDALKRVITISGKLKPKTWAYLSIVQAVLAALCFWVYQDFPKYEAGHARQIAVQGHSDLEQTQQEKTVISNRSWEWGGSPISPIGTVYYWSSMPKADQLFSGEVTGTGFVAGSTQLYFCVNDGTNCYKHPQSRVKVNGPMNLRAMNDKLAVGTEATEEVRRSQQLLANAEDQLKRVQKLSFSADGRRLVIDSSGAASNSLIRLLPSSENPLIVEPVDTPAFDHVVVKGFSKVEAVTIREALRTNFTSRNTEAFNRLGLRSSYQVVWNWGDVSQCSRELYSIQSQVLGLVYTKTSDDYQSEFSTSRAQGGTLPPVVRSIEIAPARAVNDTFAISLYGSNFSSRLNVVIIDENTSSYYSAYSHLWSKLSSVIDTPNHGSGINTHLARRPYGSAVENMRLSTSILEEAEAITNAIEWRRGAPTLALQASDTIGLEDNPSEYNTIHFSTHGFNNNEHLELPTLLSMVGKDGQQEGGFLQLPFRELPRIEPPTVLKVVGVESKSLLDTLLKLMLLAQAIIFSIGSAISSAFAWVAYRRGRLDLKLKELQLREAEIKLENMERDRARATQEAAQSKIVLLS